MLTLHRVMDGLTFAKNVRALQESGEITTECLPIISVSANARAEQIQAAIDAGMVCDDHDSGKENTNNVYRMTPSLSLSEYRT